MKGYTFNDCDEPSNQTGSWGGTNTVSKTVSGLESGKAYFWKVIAEDDKGGSTESETRRFTTKIPKRFADDGSQVRHTFGR